MLQSDFQPIFFDDNAESQQFDFSAFFATFDDSSPDLSPDQTPPVQILPSLIIEDEMKRKGPLGNSLESSYPAKQSPAKRIKTDPIRQEMRKHQNRVCAQKSRSKQENKKANLEAELEYLKVQNQQLLTQYNILSGEQKALRFVLNSTFEMINNNEILREQLSKVWMVP